MILELNKKPLAYRSRTRKCGKVECTHIWFSSYGRCSRCVLARFTNLQYGTNSETYLPLGEVIWGFSGIIPGDTDNLHDTLFIEEKVFKNKKDALKDRDEFI